MPYPDLDPGKFGPGMPLDISNLDSLWKGVNKTNGFLMRNVDGRIPALQQPIGRLSIGAASVLNVNDLGTPTGVVPWGNGLWRDIATVGTRTGYAYAEKPAKARLAGVLKFNQGFQAGNPVIPWGVPQYSKGEIITKGPVGYKHAMTAVGQEEDYLRYVQDVHINNEATVRTTWTEWMAMYSAANDGDRLGLFMANDSGFPIVAVVPAANVGNPTLANASFAGFATVFEKEHEAIFFWIDC